MVLVFNFSTLLSYKMLKSITKKHELSALSVMKTKPFRQQLINYKLCTN